MRRRFFWSIFGVAAFTAVMLSGLAIGSINTVRANATRSEMERTATVVADLVVERLGDRRLAAALVQGDALEEFGIDLATLRRSAGGSDLTFFAIGPAGNVVGRPAIGALELDLDALRQGATISVERTIGSGSVLVTAVPIEQPVRESTVVVLLTRAAPVQVELPRGFVVTTLLLVAGAAVVLARLLSGGLTRRLRSVERAASALAEGDLSARAEVGGTDEVHTVAEAFNDMAGELAATRERERQFLLAVGHDLRTPLTTITGYSEALEDGLDDPAEVRRIAGVMSAEVTRLRRLIEDVMLLSRLESAEFGLRSEPVDVDAHVRGLIEPYADRARTLRVGFEYEAGSAGRRLVDPDRVGQIIGNLCENALRFTPEAGRITVALSGEPDRIEISVANTGPGIDEDDLPRVFDRFFVASRSRAVRPEGSGLGLSIVDVLTRAMGGSVRAESSDGLTVFAVRLPAPPV